MRSLLRWVWGVSFALLAAVSSSAAAGEVQAVKQLDINAMLGDWKIVDYYLNVPNWLQRALTPIPPRDECEQIALQYSRNGTKADELVLRFSCAKPINNKQIEPQNCRVKLPSNVEAPGALQWKPAWWFPHWVLMVGDKDSQNKYSYLVIGGPKRYALKILSRTGVLSELDKQKIRGQLTTQGYDTSKLAMFGQ